MEVAVTGASGFIGGRLVANLEDDHGVRRIPRGADPDLGGLDAVVHLAGVAGRGFSRQAYQAGNVELACEIARRAIDAGVARFVFASSLYVHGIWSEAPVAPDTPLRPFNLYSESKAAAEQRLTELCRGTRTRLTLVRLPPLADKPGAGAAGLIGRAVAHGFPLPLGRAEAPRALIYAQNAVAAFRHVIGCEAPAPVLIPSEAPDISMAELARRIGRAQGRPARLFDVDPALVRAGLTALGKGAIARQLFSPLTVDRAHWRDWAWRPAP